jgi:hypothetical protein
MQMTLAASNLRFIYRGAILAACGFDLDFLQQAEERFADMRAQDEIRTRVGEQNARYRAGLAQRGLPRF